MAGEKEEGKRGRIGGKRRKRGKGGKGNRGEGRREERASGSHLLVSCERICNQDQNGSRDQAELQTQRINDSL